MWPPEKWGSEKTILGCVFLVLFLIAILIDGFYFWRTLPKLSYSGYGNFKRSIAEWCGFSFQDSLPDNADSSRKTKVQELIESTKNRATLQLIRYAANLISILFVPIALITGVDPITMAMWLPAYICLAYIRHKPKCMNMSLRNVFHCSYMALIAAWMVLQDEPSVILLPMNLVACLRCLCSLTVGAPRLTTFTNIVLSSVVIVNMYINHSREFVTDESGHFSACAYSANGISNVVKFAVYEIATCTICCTLLWGINRRIRWEAEIFAEMRSLSQAKEEQVEQDTMRGLMVAVFDVVGHLEWRPDADGSRQPRKLHFVDEPNQSLDALFKQPMAGRSLESAVGDSTSATSQAARCSRERGRLLEYINSEVASATNSQSRVPRKIELTCECGDETPFEAELLIRQGSMGRPIFGIIIRHEAEGAPAVEECSEKAQAIPAMQFRQDTMTAKHRGLKESESNVRDRPCCSSSPAAPPNGKVSKHNAENGTVPEYEDKSTRPKLSEFTGLNLDMSTMSTKISTEDATPKMSTVISTEDTLSFGVPSSTSVAIQRAENRCVQAPAASTESALSVQLSSACMDKSEGSDGIAEVEERPRQEQLRNLVDSDMFQGVIGIVIVLNSIVLASQTDHDSGYIDIFSEKTFFLVDVVFTTIFVIEITLRILVFRVRFFKDVWNLFELALVALGVVDLLVSILVENSSNLGMLMLLRILRLLKLLRVGRIIHLFRELKMLCDGILSSLSLLAWSSVLLLLLIFAMAIFCTREIGVFWVKGNFPEEEKERMQELFGSVMQSMYTLFQIQTLESWSEGIARPVMRRRPELVLFFVPYVVLLTICVLNVVVAIIVEKVMKESVLENETEKIQQIEAQRKTCAFELQALFSKAAGDDEEISREEWVATLRLPEVKPVVRSLGLELDTAVELFDILDIDGSETLNFEEFLPVLLRGLHGVRHSDLLGIQLDIWRNAKVMMASMKHLHDTMNNLPRVLGHEIKSLVRQHCQWQSGHGILHPRPLPWKASAGYALNTKSNNPSSISGSHSASSSHVYTQKKETSSTGSPATGVGKSKLCTSTSAAIRRAGRRHEDKVRLSTGTGKEGLEMELRTQLYQRSRSTIQEHAGLGSLEWLEDLEPVKGEDGPAGPRGCRIALQMVVDSDKFQGFIGLVIVLNSIILASQTDHDSGFVSILSDHFFFMADVIFTSIFVVEIIMRIVGHGVDFFRSKWNLFELVLVALGVVDLVVSVIVENDANLGVLMLLRVLRLLKLLRVGRVLHVFRELQMLCDGIVHSLRLMAWSVVLLLLIIFALAIFCTREIGIFWIQKDFTEEGETERMKELFGSVLQSMYTLFQVQTLESWSEAISRPVMKRRPELALFFVSYAAFITICVLNVIVAIIVENVCKETLVENELEKQQNLVEERRMKVQNLKAIWQIAKGDDDELTKQEWTEMLKRSDVSVLFTSLGIAIEVAADLFDVLDTDSSGSLNLEEFLPVLMRGIQEVRHVDVLGVQLDVWRNAGIMESHLEHLQAQLKEMPALIEQMILHHIVEPTKGSQHLTSSEPNQKSDHVTSAASAEGFSSSSSGEGYSACSTSEFRPHTKSCL